MRRLALSLLAALLFASCQGIFDGIYDDPPSVVAFSNHFDTSDPLSPTLCLDLSSHTRWLYVNLHNLTIDTLASSPTEWDFALHHYDVSAGLGSAAIASCSDISQASPLLASSYFPDVDSSVIVDLSNMLDGNLGYAPARVNPILSRWLDVDLSHMPPSYSLSDEVYLLRMADSTVAALQFIDYRDASGRKGFATIKFRYPIS